MNKLDLKAMFRKLTSSPKRTFQSLICLTALVCAASPLWTLANALVTVVGALLDLVMISAATALVLLIVAKWRKIVEALKTEARDVLETVSPKRIP